MFGRSRRERRLRKVKPGDGRPLKPYRWWNLLSRSVFYYEVPAGGGGAVLTASAADEPLVPASLSETGAQIYAVDVRYWADEIDTSDEKERLSRGKPVPNAQVELYRDGVQTHRANAPASFEVPGGFIDVALSSYGLKRMHLVSPDGTARPLRPHPESAEGWRARFGRRFPLTSRLIGAVAIGVLLVGLVVGIPQLIEFASRTEIVSENLGTFTSPIRLPEWANLTLLIAGIVAGIERALTLRSHWLIDLETTVPGMD